MHTTRRMRTVKMNAITQGKTPTSWPRLPPPPSEEELGAGDGEVLDGGVPPCWARAAGRLKARTRSRGARQDRSKRHMMPFQVRGR
jgi:hypothetical protein